MSDNGNEGSRMVLGILTERGNERDDWRRRAKLAKSVVTIDFQPKVKHVRRGDQREDKGGPHPSQRHCLGEEIGGYDVGHFDRWLSKGNKRNGV